MRTLLVLLALCAVASADAKRECYLHKPKVKVTNLGCFDDIKTTDDHTYGSRLCLIRAQNKCSAVLYTWDGNPEANASILDDVTCGTTGAVSFSGSLDAGASIYLINFTGKIAKRVLRGKYSQGKSTTTIAWKQTKDGFDAADKIRTVTKAVCAPAAP